MIPAYAELYLDDAMQNMGEMLDYAINGCGLDGDQFISLYIASGLAREFESGVPATIAGRSGIELALEILERVGVNIETPEAAPLYDYSAAYWSGWILAYYQWTTSLPFHMIHRYLSIEDLLRMYPTLHEATEDRIIDAIEALVEQRTGDTNLKTRRRIAGYTQRELAARSQVSLRAIQQYEQRQKDINQAASASLQRLSRILGCRLEDLLERKSPASQCSQA